MADKLQISIVGLGLIGASAGLALRRFPDRVRVVGHDRDPGIAGRAKSIGAVERTEWNLINAVSGADRIILAEPVNRVRETLTAVAGDLKPGCIILNMSTVDHGLSDWAASTLPPNVYLVGGHPVVLSENLDTENARAELFADRLFCLAPGTHVPPDAANLAADLAEALGSKPYFLDPVEHDGLMAAVEHLPALLAGALLHTASASGGWKDLRKVAGNQFYTSTLLVPDDAAAAASALVANRENLLRWMELLQETLQNWQERIAAGDEEGLTKAFAAGLRARGAWLHAQSTGDWTEGPALEIPTTGSNLRGLFGLRSLERKPKKR